MLSESVAQQLLARKKRDSPVGVFLSKGFKRSLSFLLFFAPSRILPFYLFKLHKLLERITSLESSQVGIGSTDDEKIPEHIIPVVFKTLNEYLVVAAACNSPVTFVEFGVAGGLKGFFISLQELLARTYPIRRFIKEGNYRFIIVFDLFFDPGPQRIALLPVDPGSYDLQVGKSIIEIPGQPLFRV